MLLNKFGSAVILEGLPSLHPLQAFRIHVPTGPESVPCVRSRARGRVPGHHRGQRYVAGMARARCARIEIRGGSGTRVVSGRRDGSRRAAAVHARSWPADRRAPSRTRGSVRLLVQSGALCAGGENRLPESGRSDSIGRRGAWSKRYVTALTDSHDVIVERAKQRLGRDLAQRLQMRHLARELACSVPVLHRRFVSKAGETPIRYQARLRAIEAVRLLQATNWKIDAVARAVGWKEPKRPVSRARALRGNVSADDPWTDRRQTLRSCRPGMADPSSFRCPPPASREMGFLRNGAITTCGVEFDA